MKISLTPLRWKMTIETTTHKPYVSERDEIQDFQEVVEEGPDWQEPGYKITIEYQPYAS